MLLLGAPELPLAEAARAHELMETGAASGKIILVP
ncbi:MULTISPECIES: zinc-binding dehydrogenase [unclassified Microbacterium]|nr:MULTISPECIES: zinc-binding dehydrogenase [unclassified Microbacterium]MDH5134820.1 zinc-binding dehydrogenase [Microbacterium sp. RD10]MDH5138392.1 zinc-binding dehydrogenase [Microbacterium sp. RD11]MDH5144651.1 zinc-binding dehydrogenase [Microbacterium sp. RD12]MDH5154666.1 zinc-binding dehydrogenase [Microbacterium sp. RD06]MDH5167721.1 zinc-binding dehydrogenase [Microbacterium sp. RD02]